VVLSAVVVAGDLGVEPGRQDDEQFADGDVVGGGESAEIDIPGA
jgi:hypothetical protein